MISCRAPGKLFIAGEYAVVEPGHRAVLTAVDRYATATITEVPADAATTLRSDLDGGTSLTCHRDGDRLVPATPDAAVPAAFAYVFAAASTLDRLRAERGIVSRPYDLAVSTDLGDPDGRKYGLGSSAAVTVAAVAALGRFHDLDLSPMDRYRLAMLATIAVNPRASGGDVAAATWGGWLAYTSPDRTFAAALAANDGIDAALHAPWPGLSVRPLRTPTRLALHIGWTGNPASTPDLVAAATADPAAVPTRRVAVAEAVPAAGTARDRRAAFNARSNDCVGRLLLALDADDPVAVRAEIDRARDLLVDLDDSTGLGIMTPRLRELCAAGAAVGAATKPSGAGGGDCGIALIERDRPAAIAELTGRWVAAGIRPLPLRIHPTEGEIA
ncbi:phosphomevalonate kinase [Nocardia asteroides NBRC 15531]|uniref:phosphomevalonate kinase n=1 Tax=Nocardia asteroides NBRC 15531 TaxID=1110697 RepID=U5EH12_NOCAS|nr:phosphomevalonate kinase [Nocardia asteroides]TLF67532.1 phosphomevalonate kinase [Nocardia asteroides NBRC 15531]UGT50969.1 phosphomevalonate kinase [Nocardia asteroides]SFN43327.1 phosphomevalonate kinase [Nocardia asteroides]VEG36172.1 mevalonate kinase [Nocardia asteroides]GAD85666.1 phosphomevalonate kinase [Nocardia asteroides NBRC 15531]